MPLDPLMLQQVIVQERVSPVCATCVHFWTARDQKAPNCGQDCGGPIAGNDFPMYSGPMTQFDRFCFACPSPADYAVKSPGTKRPIGLCKVHLGHLDRLVAEGEDAPFTLTLLSAKGIVYPTAGRFTPKNLGETMYDQEVEWYDQGVGLHPEDPGDG